LAAATVRFAGVNGGAGIFAALIFFVADRGRALVADCRSAALIAAFSGESDIVPLYRAIRRLLADAEGIASAGLNPSLVLELRARLAEVALLLGLVSAIGAIVAEAIAWAEGQPREALGPLDAKFVAALDD
jgi:hypothetical protein